MIAVIQATFNIEITENVLINDPEMTMKILYQIESLGIKIHLDDFGNMVFLIHQY